MEWTGVSDEPLRVLFLCTGNSCRSQMAEGWGRALLGDGYEVFSAGTLAQGLNPLAVKAMAVHGVDISRHTSKRLDELADITFDWVVTVCDNARDNCPVLPGATRVIHHAFDDPPALAAAAENEEQALQHYLRVCDEIRGWVEGLPARLASD